MKRKRAAAQGLPEPYAGNDFVDPDNLQVRLIKYRILMPMKMHHQKLCIKSFIMIR
ncbi:hypothetical protein [Commensalibacter intestini]|uniref:hypothetical protein n=1 Tax=Commensalibacter intestini TaxID=479936 RepID=UPI0014782371|nr:hypothetical protein [Commensalibacter intestini]